MILEQIQKPNDIKRLPEEELPVLAKEIRRFLIESLSKTGGHLASNLGVVELTIALHRVFKLPQDKIIWDVGHQSYTHKILTGRKDGFANLRSYGGLSGFPKREESACDSFDTGHSSTSISAGLGYVQARDLKKENYSVVSVIGDGALTGGMAYEAMNNAAELEKNFIIVLNDNDMSISKNVGGISSYLGSIRTASAYTELKMGVTKRLKQIPGIGEGLVDALRKTKSSIKQFVIPGMFFEHMGLTYLGPVDGHNILQLERVLQEAKRFQGPVLVHVLTEKGRGYEPAVRQPSKFHGMTPFEIRTGLPKKRPEKAGYTDVFSNTMLKLGEEKPELVAVTAAMPAGTGLKRFQKHFPDRMFDVGIAEPHAVTFAAGLALGGMVPVVAVYSSFLQRAVDQILHDVCMQKLHVVFAVDRAGLVGSDGETHQGCFDLSYLSMMPNMTVMAPKNNWELAEMLRFAVEAKGPIAVRYPRGAACSAFRENCAPLIHAEAEVLEEGSEIALLAVGSMVETAAQVLEKLKAAGQKATLVNMRFVKPFDTELLKRLAKNHHLFVTLEENVKTGGFGEQTAVWAAEHLPNIRLLTIAVPDCFVPHGAVDLLKEKLELDAESIFRRIQEREKK